MKLCIINMILTVLMLTLTSYVLAAPLPPEIIINNSSKECAMFIAGDECMDCAPPLGWQSLGYTSDSSCPANYTMVSARGICKGFEVLHCCTEGHSGASGECRNMVRNNFAKECAFVKDASNCTLPVGWLKMPENISSVEWLCPNSYNWTSINCTAPGIITG
jgi:hypothetical protein